MSRRGRDVAAAPEPQPAQVEIEVGEHRVSVASCDPLGEVVAQARALWRDYGPPGSAGLVGGGMGFASDLPPPPVLGGLEVEVPNRVLTAPPEMAGRIDGCAGREGC